MPAPRPWSQAGGRLMRPPDSRDARSISRNRPSPTRREAPGIRARTCRAEDFASAKEAAERGLELLDTGPAEEETGAAWHYVMGRALDGLDRNEDAIDAYLKALVAGGRQNRWPARADTALRALYAEDFETRAGGIPLAQFARERFLTVRIL